MAAFPFPMSDNPNTPAVSSAVLESLLKSAKLSTTFLGLGLKLRALAAASETVAVAVACAVHRPPRSYHRAP